MLKIYVVAAIVAGFGTSYSMEKEPSKTTYAGMLKSLVARLTGYGDQNELIYLEDARQLSWQKSLYFSVLPKDVLGIVQYYRLHELLDRVLRYKTYSEALASIQKLAQLPEHTQVFNNPTFIDSIINSLSGKFGKDAEKTAGDINTPGASSWLTHIRPDQLKLLEAADRGKLVKVQQLIDGGVSVNAQDRYCMTALICSALHGYTEVVKILIGAGAYVNAQDKLGWTALMYAAAQGHTEVVKILIGQDGDVNARDEKGNTALILAASWGYIGVVKELIKAGADVNAQNVDGMTALMWAATRGNAEMLKELIAVAGPSAMLGINSALERRRGSGANVNAQNVDGWTALMVAAHQGHTEIVKALIAAEADVAIQNNHGYTALHYAQAEGYKEIIKLLELIKNI